MTKRTSDVLLGQTLKTISNAYMIINFHDIFAVQHGITPSEYHYNVKPLKQVVSLVVRKYSDTWLAANRRLSYLRDGLVCRITTVF